MVTNPLIKKDHSKMLNEITLSFPTQGHPNLFINSQTWCVSELYCSFLKYYNTGKVVKCNVSIKDDWGDLIDYYNSYTDVITIRLNFDFEQYSKLSKFEMKRMQLETIHKGMMMIAQKEGWTTNELLDAYNSSLKQKLEYKFFAKNGKLKSSPDRKYKIGFWCEWDLDKFEVYYVLFNKYDEELKRDLMLKCKPSEGEFIYYVEWKWLNNETVLLENKYKYGNNENWEVSIVFHKC